MILNPNCSEIVAKLPVSTVEEAKEFLEKNSNIKVINFDIFFGAFGGLSKDKRQNVIDPNNPNTLDFKNSSSTIICKGDYGYYNAEDGEGIYVVANQHCQQQLYETVRRLEGEKNLDFYGYDGGGEFEEIYDNWLAEMGPGKTPDHQIIIRKITKKIFERKETIEELNNMNEITRAITSTWQAREIRKRNIKDFLKRLAATDEEFQKDIQEYINETRKNDSNGWTKKETDEDLKNSMFDDVKQGVAKAIILCVSSKEIREIFFKNAREVQK